jgi:signal transduction histidine kinase
MQERAESLGGTFQIVTQPGAGCKVCVVLPLQGLL